jgi:hypothetical protein
MSTYCYSYRSSNKWFSVECEPYTKTFPYEWAINHLPNTGPKECRNCQHNGSWNGVFVCYCTDCATLYDGLRGPGMAGPFYNGENLLKSEIDSPLAAMNTYMKGIKFSDIGDKDFCDSVGQNSDNCFHGGTMLSHFSIQKFTESSENEDEDDCASLYDENLWFDETYLDDDEQLGELCDTFEKFLIKYFDPVPMEQDLYEEYDDSDSYDEFEDYNDF